MPKDNLTKIDVFMIPLFRYHPVLAKSLNYQELGCFPTPVMKCNNIGRELCRSDLFIKRDDLSGKVYGGNKIRKLEFIFGDIKASGSRTVITSGAAGSNHALAVALYGAESGLRVILMLFEQFYNPDICKNLLVDYATGAQMHHDSNYESHQISMRKIINELSAENAQKIFVIPPGGSSVSGVVGYVNAAFELKEQIANGQLPEPAEIYVAMGTMGTAVGLMLGMKAVNIKSKLIPVRVVPSYVSDDNKFMMLFESANRVLHDADSSFPVCKLSRDDLNINSDFLGQDYGITTAQSIAAIETLKKNESLQLDGVYTGKTFAAFLEAAKNKNQKGPVLFWNTKNSLPLPSTSPGLDYRKLPEAFHHYFIRN